MVVTIIVLLILASVAISLTIGNNGILKQAEDAVERTEISALEEKIDLTITQTILEHTGNTSATIDDIIENLVKNDIIEDSSKVNRENGDITTKNPSYIISGKLDDYLVNSKDIALDTISLVQTAESKLADIHNMLLRLLQLMYMSNDESLRESDKINIQKEITELIKEIDRISENTSYNGEKLLDGTFNKKIYLETESIDIVIDSASSNSLEIANINILDGDSSIFLEQIQNAINKISDSRSYIGATQNMIQGYVTYKENLEQAVTYNQIALSALSDIKSSLNRMNEIIDNIINNEEYSPENDNVSQKEIDRLCELIDIIAKITDYNKTIILGDMTSENLGINNINLLNIEEAKQIVTEAITKVDEKIELQNNTI